jgi:hypothetical protein
MIINTDPIIDWIDAHKLASAGGLVALLVVIVAKHWLIFWLGVKRGERNNG